VGLLRCLCARSRWNAELGERRQLEQIEQALRADDPRFASAVHAADPRVRYKRRGTEAALGFLVGVGLLQTARRQGPALWQAGGIWADGAAGGALAASPAGRPLTPGCPLPSSCRGHAAVIIAC
jgi:hypothetical protein